MSSMLNGDYFEFTARELGLKFKRIRDIDHEIVRDPSKRDPDLLILVDCSEILAGPRGQCDALIFWKHKELMVRWNGSTKLSIRKLMTENGNVSRCAVCSGDVPLQESFGWTTCNGKLCTICMIKIYLTYSADISVGNDYNNIRETYWRIRDDFSIPQQRVVHFIKPILKVHKRSGHHRKRSGQERDL